MTAVTGTSMKLSFQNLDSMSQHGLTCRGVDSLSNFATLGNAIGIAPITNIFFFLQELPLNQAHRDLAFRLQLRHPSDGNWR
jgi:hypothetical protein